MESSISGVVVPGQDGRHIRTSDPIGVPWGSERRSGHDRRRGERRYEARADRPDRRNAEERRAGHWRCLSGQHAVPPS